MLRHRLHTKILILMQENVVTAIQGFFNYGLTTSITVAYYKIKITFVRAKIISFGKMHTILLNIFLQIPCLYQNNDLSTIKVTQAFIL